MVTKLCFDPACAVEEAKTVESAEAQKIAEQLKELEALKAKKAAAAEKRKATLKEKKNEAAKICNVSVWGLDQQGREPCVRPGVRH